MRRFFGWDYLGIIFSGLCVLHCLAVPLILLLFPAFGFAIFPQEDLTHVVLLAFILGVAGVAFWSGYRVHGQWQPVAWMSVGSLLIIYATFFVHHQLGHFWEPVVAIAGSVCLIRAHYLNHNCRRCEHDHKTHHHEEAELAECKDHLHHK